MHELLSIITGRSRRATEIFPMAGLHSQLEQGRPVVFDCTQFVHCLFDFILVRRHHHMLVATPLRYLTERELLRIASHRRLTAHTVVSAIVEDDMLEVRRAGGGDARQNAHVHQNGTVAVQTEDLKGVVMNGQCGGREIGTVRFGR